MRSNLDLFQKIKQEIERLLKVGFICTAKYVEWLLNIIFFIKKNEQVKACINFKNLNLTTPKDEYIMLIANMLVNVASTHGILAFMIRYLGYDQIFVVKQDTYKIAFQCLGALGIYEWVVMSFDLKNVGTTYLRAMNVIFHENMEVYIDNVIVKSKDFDWH